MSPAPTPKPKPKAKGIPTSVPVDESVKPSTLQASTPKDATPNEPRPAPSKATTKRTPNLDPDELAALEEQRDFLLRSLADLDREHDAGDLTDDDYQTLKDDYTARAADVLRAIRDRHAAFAEAKKPRSLARSFAVVGAVAVFAVVSGFMVAQAMGSRKAGESASGGITVAQTNSQRANECSAKINTDPNAAMTCLEDIIEKDPENAVALTWSAWLLSLSAQNLPEPDRTIQQGIAAVRLDAAVESDPNYSYARAFRAIVAVRNGRFEEAQQYLQDFKDRNPSADAAGLIEQFDIEGQIADGLAGSTTTTSPTPGN